MADDDIVAPEEFEFRDANGAKQTLQRNRDPAKGVNQLAANVTLAAILAKLIAAPATAANQTTLIGHVDGIETLLTALNSLVTTQNGYLDGVETALSGAQPAGENHVGAVGGNTVLVPVTFTPDTLALSAGDVAADTQVIANAMRINDGTGVLQSLVLFDKDDQAAAGIDLVFFSANTSLGTENLAPSISDANAENILGIVSLVSSDWIDLGGVKVATKTGIGLVLKAATGTTGIYCALIVRGTPTQTSTGIVGRFGILQD